MDGYIHAYSFVYKWSVFDSVEVHGCCVKTEDFS